MDAAGTAHIVWNQDGGETGGDQLRYCRLKRGATGCDKTAALIPQQPGTYNSPAFNDDIAGPRVVAIGDDLVFLSHRYPNVVAKPDGTQTDRTTYAWISDDGGNTITGPAIVGDGEPSGGAVVFGNRIGLISDTRTGGTFFQSIAPGTYTSAEANLGAGGPDRAYSGSLAASGSSLFAAFADLAGNTYIRQLGGGEPSNPASWSQTQTSGVDPRLASGPSGVFLVTAPQARDRLQVRQLNGITPGRAATVRTGGYGARDFFEDPGGALRLAWVDRDGKAPELLERSSGDGRRFEASRVVARDSAGIDSVDLGATTDGGGFAAYTTGGSSQGYGKILAAPFGNQAPTKLRGIGNLPGDGRDPDVTTSAAEISYGAVQMLSQRGTFLSVPGKAGIKATEGSFLLNGLEIVPDAGVRVQMSTRSGAKTIDSVNGRVTVQLRAGGSEPIVLYRGELHIELPGTSAGTRLFSVDLAKFAPKIAGFPVSGDFDVILKKHSVEIPVQLTLPKVFGGLTGAATLRADNENGLSVDSVSFRVPKFVLGPLELSDIEVSWTSSSDTWTGSAGLRILGAGASARVTFVKGRFEDGSVTISPVPFPGVKLAPDVFLNRVSGELHLGDDRTYIRAGALFGAQPLPPDAYVATVDGRITATITPKFALDFDGFGTIATIPTSEAHAHADVDGYFSVSATAKFDLPAINGLGKFDAWFDTSKGTFAGKIDSTVTIGEDPFDVDIGVSALVSNEMVAGCEKPLGGFAYYFKTREFDISVGSCPGEPPIPAWAAGAARAAGAGPPGFSLPGGLPSASVQVTGTAAAPAPVLISPAGARVTAVPINAANASGAPAVYARIGRTTSIGLRTPQGGNWQVDPAAGAVAEVAVARELTQPKVTAKVSGKGRRRVLSYRATARKGLIVRFYERIGRGAREIGVVKNARGKLRFSAGDGPGGKRVILAQAEQQGLPVVQRNVASYRAPGPIVPARVRGLKVRRSGSSLVASWRRAGAAQQYVVRLDVSDGRHLLKLVRGRKVRLAGVARSETVRVRVTGRNAKGRQGKAAKAKLAKARRRR